jgi:hypothetical protein
MVILFQTFFVAQLSRGGSAGFGADMVLPCIDVSIRMVHINALTKFLEGHRPGTALIGVAKLGNPKLKFEIEAVAAVKPPTASL